MAEPLDNSIEKGFRDEVATYIPLLNDGLTKIGESSDSEGAVQELYRLVHIICGAASLIGRRELSLTANRMESALEDVMSGILPVSDALISTMRRTVGVFERYGKDACNGDEDSLVEDISESFRQARDLPGCRDELSSPFGPDASDLDMLLAKGPSTPMVDPFMDEEDDAVDPDGVDLGGAESDLGGAAAEIVAVFYEEAEAHFETINKSLEALEKRVTGTIPFGGDERDLIRGVCRAVHTIKGASGLVGMDALSSWAHDVEDLLDWLCEEAVQIDPDLVLLLLRSTDILERFVTDPDEVASGDTAALRASFHRITGAGDDSAPFFAPDAGSAPEPGQDTAGIFDNPPAEDGPEEEMLPDASASSHAGTFRVGMERLDELVNLTSEQVISLSAFDQRLDAFQNTVRELALCKSRLSEISRNLETGFEVKAIRGAGSAVPQGTGPDEFGDFDALELDRYSQFNLIIRDLAESVTDLSEIAGRIGNLHSGFDGYMVRQRVLLGELQGKLMRTRMAPMSVITTRMRRAVREVSEKLNKKIRLTIRGEEIELDRVIWEKLADPLLHILRNAADHGIEMPEDRRGNGKPETGRILVAAAREGNAVLIRIQDDGAGIDFAGIRERAGRMFGPDRAASMGETELSDLVFEPGFSTRREVTQISGRGVGLDVVRTNIQELRGTVSILSRGSGNGTVLTVRIPLTLAMIRAVICRVGARAFAVPLNEIRDILRISPENIVEGPVESVVVDGEACPLYRLSRILGIPGTAQASFAKAPVVLRVKFRDITAALAVDALIGQREIVIKSLGSHLKHVKGISGATIMGDGSIVPILNVGELLSDSAGIPEDLPVEDRLPEKEPLEILVVDDSVSVRRVLADLMAGQGWKTHSARDGLEALEKLSGTRPDLIVLDVEMPRMNGYEFLKARRSDPRCREIPVVILTSRSTAKYREKARELGADGYVVKPFNDKAFVSVIENLTDRRAG